MGRIQKLDSQTTNMIAAGEVVERPMGVVKELVENAIDAGSTRIVITAEQGGIEKITVQDNGCGMDSQDAKMCFERHATSKIHNQNDLWAIHTLGFRGEALPSIAAVAKVTLRTSDGNDSTETIISYGKLQSVTPYPCNQGTEISVEGLFYHTPARLKHMKSGSYEASLIQNVISSFALSHPEIAFQFIHDGREVFRTSGQGDLLEVIYTVFGRMAAENAIPVSFHDFDYEVKGYLIKPSITRASRNMMHIFLNGRMVRTYKLYKAVKDGYHGYIPEQRYPMCILSVEMDPHLLDVNVHPSKWEVRISKEIQLETLLRDKTAEALSSGNSVTPAKVHETKTEYYEPLSMDMEELQEKPKTFTLDEELKKAIRSEAEEDNQILKEIEEKNQVKQEEEKPVFPALEVLGQFHHNYMIASSDTGLVVIDQKGAYQRILYEKILHESDQNTVIQDLLVPVTIHCDDVLVNRCQEINDALQDIHIQLEPFGTDTLAVHSIPSWMKDIDEQAFFNDLLDQFKNDNARTYARMAKERAARLAIKHTSRRKNTLSVPEMQEMVHQLSECDNPFHTPQGKPVFVIFEEKDLAKEFR